MKTNLKYVLGVFFAILLTLSSCTEEKYSLGDLTAPSNIAITADIVGKTATTPDGDGSGDIRFSIVANNALSYKIDYDANDPVNLVYLPTGSVTKKYTTLGTNTYRVTVIAYGKGGTSSSVTKDVTVKSTFAVKPEIVADLTGGTSKTWIVDKSVVGHFGVGPWSATSATSEWWTAGINEKVNCCNCFYTAQYKFTKLADKYTLQVITDGTIFANASNDNLGISGAGESCYAYAGSTKDFAFGPATSGITINYASTKTNINVVGIDGFIGYGSATNSYEILELTPTTMFLRAQGTNPGIAWYIKMKAI